MAGSHRGGRPESSADLADEDTRWPRFSPAARAAGFRAAYAVPMRLRHTVIGSLNLLKTVSVGVDETRTPLTRDDTRAWGLAGVSTAGRAAYG